MVQSVAILFVNREQKKDKSLFLVNELTTLGYQVEKVLLIDELEKIVAASVAAELNTLSKLYDIVIVLGAANISVVSKALKKISCEETENSSNELPSAAKKLTNGMIHPVIYLQRIFLLREDVFEEQFVHILKPHLKTYISKGTFTKVVQLQKNGNTSCILKKLDKFASVELEDMQQLLKVTIRSEKFESIVDCEKLLKEELGDNFLQSYEENDVLNCIYQSGDGHIRQALESIEKCLDTYGIENTFVSFNGGKDCTVLLHLVHVVLRAKYPTHLRPMFCVYVKSDDAFSEQDAFIAQCETFYHLDVVTVTLGMKEALERVLERQPNLRACFMGTRRTDPYSAEMNVFQMTDPDWPQILRVNPILEWHYSDVWDYLLYYKVPYCKLYDAGYTSLGNASNTLRNPSLAYYDAGLGTECYLPAYKMMNESKERSGRNAKL